MKRAINFLVCALLCSSPLSGAQSDSSATELTVRLYSTRVVSKLHIDPMKATMRTCADCKPLPATAMDIAWDRLGNGLSADGKPLRALWLDGQLQTTADDGKLEAGAGHWVITASKDGLHVALSIPSERYVMAVVSAETAPGEPMESLKALAVAARSFAITNPHRHGDEGLCDSTHCQAMRMGQVPDALRTAVLETAGETLWFADRQVPGYFTQNCGGQSADAAEVWGGGKKPWLVSHPDSYCKRQPALWHAEISEQQLSDALAAEGWHAANHLDSVRIASRDSSGRVSRLELAGSGQRLTVAAASLRFAIDRTLGWNQVRSDGYTVHLDAASRKVVFDGKGYGHGVGLCQAGAAEMAREGRSYRDIFAFYFPGAIVRVTAADHGWVSFAAQGWTLRGTGPSAEAIAAGDAALLKARELWRSDKPVQPTVTVAPTTELFRQIANAPGWELASTRGTDITLQPLSVLARNGALKALLLHEFLHAMVESEASANTPLWLREGLVEVLAGEHGGGAAMQASAIDDALLHADTLQRAQQAHLAACALVQGFVNRYGMASVRTWLRSGVPSAVLTGK